MADMRKCIGSAKFGIVAHEAPVGEFPIQPSQKDGLGRMCKPHWTEYTRALRAAAKTPSVIDRPSHAAIEAGGTVTIKRVSAKPANKPKPIRTRPARGRKTEGEQIVEEASIA